MDNLTSSGDGKPGDAGAEPGQTTARAWAILGLLTLGAVLSMMDRMILGLLVTPIKQSLALSDTAISLLQGLSFVLLYSCAGIPIGLAVDRGPRMRILAFGIALWSLATAMCGLAGRFGTLFLARVGVGIGEASLQPAGYSLIPDLFPKRRLGLAVGIFTTGTNVGTAAALLVGGFLIEHLTARGAVTLPLLGTLQPWQQTFVILGLPGLLLAVAMAAVREPPRVSGISSARPARIGHWWRANAAWLIPHHLGVAFASAVQYGSYAWIVAFFQRVHGWNMGHTGAVTGTISLIVGLIALIGGGAVSDAVAARGAARRLLLCGGAMLAGVLPGLLYPMLPNGAAAAVMWGALIASSLVAIGSAGANLQQSTPAQLRGTAAAIFFLTANLFGMIVGTTSVALMSDHLFTESTGIRYSLTLAGGIATALGGVSFLLAFLNQRRLAARPNAVAAS